MGGITYARPGRCTDIEGCARGVSWVAHQDDGFDIRDYCLREWSRCILDALIWVTTATDRVIEYLTTLSI